MTEEFTDEEKGRIVVDNLNLALGNVGAEVIFKNAVPILYVTDNSIDILARMSSKFCTLLDYDDRSHVEYSPSKKIILIEGEEVLAALAHAGVKFPGSKVILERNPKEIEKAEYSGVGQHSIVQAIENEKPSQDKIALDGASQEKLGGNKEEITKS